MYAWYFSKKFSWTAFPSRRHDWKNVVVWIDNPALEVPNIVGVSMFKTDTKYDKEVRMWDSYFVDDDRSKMSLRFEFKQGDFIIPYIGFSEWNGEYHNLIMWEQLTEAARVAFNNSESFGKEEVLFNDEHFQANLEKAWPL